MFRFYLFITLLYFTSLVRCKLPNDVEQCPAGDENCIINNINHIFETKLDGDEEFGLLRIKPMKAGDLKLNQGGIEVDIKDMILEGAETIRATKIKGFGPKPDGVHEVLFKAPVLSLVGNYKGKGKLAILTFEGKGKSNYTLVEPVFKLTMRGKSLIKDNKVYLDVISTRFDLKKRKGVIIHYTNLFNNDKFLNEQFDALLKQESELLEAEYLPSVVESLQDGAYQSVKDVFDKTPYNEVFKIPE